MNIGKALRTIKVEPIDDPIRRAKARLAGVNERPRTQPVESTPRSGVRA